MTVFLKKNAGNEEEKKRGEKKRGGNAHIKRSLQGRRKKILFLKLSLTKLEDSFW